MDLSTQSYSALIERLYRVNLHRGVKLGLQNMMRLKQALGDPDQQFSTIHVAGTNGKGSVTTMMAKALELSGKRVGLYTSPHLSSFRERIRINGKEIPEEAVQRLLPTIFQAAQELEIPASFFELTTALAFLYFAEQKVDVVALETGLGGRFDATNVVTPLLSVITSISFDHMAILGNTLEQIAFEKAGIIKESIPVVLGPTAVGLGIEEIAAQKKSHCHVVQGQYADFLQENRLIAREALLLLQLSMPLSSEHIEEGLQSLPPCRFQEMKVPSVQTSASSPKVILDVAHNPEGLRALFTAVRKHYPTSPVRVVAGFSEGKDIQSCLQFLGKQAKMIHLIDVIHPRIMPLSRLLSLAAMEEIVVQNPTGNLTTVLPDILSLAAPNEIVLICGSCFIMHEARTALECGLPADIYPLNEHFQSQL